MTHTPAPEATTKAAPASRPFRYVRLAIIAAVAAVANALVFTVGSAAGGSMVIESPAYSQITLAMAVFATLVPLLTAGIVVWLIARRWPGFRAVAQWLGLGVAVLSMASPFVLTDDLTTAISLAAMHVIAGIAWFFAVATRRGSAR